MKMLATLSFAIVLAVALAAVLLRPAPPEPSPDPPAVPAAIEVTASVAVVELFTSEGCSSCPPADCLLLDLAERDDARLIPLAFHVDYWNRLGWRDPYSAAAYSQRQRAYARAFNSTRVYTPQMIVNGRREFVGSRKREAETAVREAFEQPAPATVTLRASVDGRTVSVNYDVDGAPGDAVLNLALVQQRTEQAVPRGENAGKTLRHANVVRVFETVPASAGTRTLTLPDGLRPSETAVIAYVQDPATMRVLGASQSELGRTTG